MSNAQVALEAAVRHLQPLGNRPSAGTVLTTAEQFKKWLDDQDRKDRPRPAPRIPRITRP